MTTALPRLPRNWRSFLSGLFAFMCLAHVQLADAQQDPLLDTAPRTIGADNLPRPVTEAFMAEISARVASRVVLLRITEQLDPRMRPNTVQWLGVAVWVQPTPDSGTHLVTTHTAVSRAIAVEVLIENDWIPARVESLSPWYDLGLVVPSGMDATVDGLIVVDPEEARIDAWLAVVNEQSVVSLLSTSIRGHDPNAEGLMLQTPSTALPGSPLLNGDGHLLGLVSARETGRRPQTLVVGASMITEWWQARDESGSEVIWRPNIELEQVDPGVGADVLGP
jgi:hypothetical protein